MTNSQFLWATPREIYYRVSGWRDQKDHEEIFFLRWMRWQTYVVGVGLDPKKAKSPQSLFMLPDEGDGVAVVGKPMTEEEYQAKQKRFEDEAHVFEKWDHEMQMRYADTV